MLNQKLGTAKILRVLQILFLSVALWFIYWAHIYEMIYWNKTFVESLVQHAFPDVLLYSISLAAVIGIELLSKRTGRRSLRKFPEATQEELAEKKQQKGELLKSTQFPSTKIGFTFVIVGALLLVYSIVVSSAILAFIGLGLTFWGALFLFARSTKFVQSTVLESSVSSFYVALDRIIDDLEYKGKPVYIPSYPKEAYLPEYLEGLKEMAVFISAEDSTTMPSIEELAKKRFLVQTPKGICFSPPGIGLVKLFEKELRTDFVKIDQETLYDSLPTIIVNNLELASNFEISREKEFIHIKLNDSIYSDLYSKEQNLKSVHSIGCPLISAVICAWAKTTGKRVTISGSRISSGLKTIEIWYKTVEG